MAGRPRALFVTKRHSQNATTWPFSGHFQDRVHLQKVPHLESALYQRDENLRDVFATQEPMSPRKILVRGCSSQNLSTISLKKASQPPCDLQRLSSFSHAGLRRQRSAPTTAGAAPWTVRAGTHARASHTHHAPHVTVPPAASRESGSPFLLPALLARWLAAHQPVRPAVRPRCVAAACAACVSTSPPGRMVPSAGCGALETAPHSLSRARALPRCPFLLCTRPLPSPLDPIAPAAWRCHHAVFFARSFLRPYLRARRPIFYRLAVATDQLHTTGAGGRNVPRLPRDDAPQLDERVHERLSGDRLARVTAEHPAAPRVARPLARAERERRAELPLGDRRPRRAEHAVEQRGVEHDEGELRRVVPAERTCVASGDLAAWQRCVTVPHARQARAATRCIHEVARRHRRERLGLAEGTEEDGTHFVSHRRAHSGDSCHPLLGRRDAC